jgi:Fe-S-cluster containining protein
MIPPSELIDKASDRKKANKDLFRKLKKKKPVDLDQVMFKLHNEVFRRINCLDCANCCKTISPFLIDRDIQRIAKFLRMKPSEFVVEYLVEDEEHDYVFKSSPCPFLMSDNYCSVYDVRPRACREYPHTDRKRFVQILDLSLKNTFICPAVFEMVEELHEVYE